MEETIEMLVNALAILQKRRSVCTGLGAPIVLIKQAIEDLHEFKPYLDYPDDTLKDL